VYDAHTKNEKGLSSNGRFFPLTDELKALLKEIKSRQDSLNIRSSFIFCNKDGEWIKEHTYVKFLRRICQKFGLKATNNHAFRMSLNSNVLIPRGISVADRAYLLGHSVQTNLNYYSFAKKDVIENARAVLNSEERNSAKKLRFSVIPFPKEIAGKACK